MASQTSSLGTAPTTEEGSTAVLDAIRAPPAVPLDAWETYKESLGFQFGEGRIAALNMRIDALEKSGVDSLAIFREMEAELVRVLGENHVLSNRLEQLKDVIKKADDENMILAGEIEPLKAAIAAKDEKITDIVDFNDKLRRLAYRQRDTIDRHEKQIASLGKTNTAALQCEAMETKKVATRLADEVKRLLDENARLVVQLKEQSEKDGKAGEGKEEEKKGLQSELEALKEKSAADAQKIKTLEATLAEKQKSLNYYIVSSYDRSVNYDRNVEKLKKRAAIAELRCLKLTAKIEKVQKYDLLYYTEQINEAQSKIEDLEEELETEKTKSEEALEAEMKRYDELDDEADARQERSAMVLGEVNLMCTRLKGLVAKYQGKLMKLRVEKKALKCKVETWKENWELLSTKQSMLREELDKANGKALKYKLKIGELDLDRKAMHDQMCQLKRTITAGTERRMKLNQEEPTLEVQAQILGVEPIHSDVEEDYDDEVDDDSDNDSEVESENESEHEAEHELEQLETAN